MRYVFGIFILAFCCDAKYIPEDGVYSVVEDMPEYEAGMKAFNTHIQEYLTENTCEAKGSVFVSFIVQQDGSLENLKVVRSLTHRSDSLAVSAVKSAPLKWKPGQDDGKAVAVQMVYPIHFEK